MTIGQAIARARDRLLAAGIPSDDAPGDAEVLARHALGWDVARLTASRREPPPGDFPERYDALIARRLAREPVSQIVGHREFWGLDFEVTRDVLTPRPETELIVEEALAAFGHAAPPGLIVDACTGSGCLAVALALEFPRARVIATDISAAALQLARRNAARHGADRRIDVLEGDLLEPVRERADLIVANPPYVSSRDAASLPPEVRDYEPHVALFAGEDGLDALRRLFASAGARLKPGGRLIVEVGYDQHALVEALARQHGWRLDRARKDLQGIPRTLVFSRGD